MPRRFTVLVLAAWGVLLAANPLAAAPAAGPDSTAAARGGWAVVPALFYSPETGTGAGGFTLRTFRPREARCGARPSTIAVGLLGTTKRQWLVLASVDLYRRAEAVRWVGEGAYRFFPTKFYGLGPDTPDALAEDFTPRTLDLRLSFSRRVVAGLRVGARVQYGRLRLAATEPGRLLASGGVPGSKGGELRGAGALLLADTRDSIFFPTRGHLHALSGDVFGGALGGFAFTRGELDLRQYWSLGPRRTFAWQGVLTTTGGAPPFTQLASIGGQDLLRGYYDGRWRDRNRAAAQVEYRGPLRGRFGFVVFAGVGVVAQSLDRLALAHAKAAGGGGLRYALNRSEGINFRLDYGQGSGSSGVYFTAMEAF